MNKNLMMVALTALVGGCQGGVKAPVTESFSDLTKADTFSSKLKVVGAVEYGQSTTIEAGKTRFRAVTFPGVQGDSVDVWVRSTTGDAVAWVLDSEFNIVGYNDDADATTSDAHIKIDALAAGNTDTFYIVVRDYNLAQVSFDVSLASVFGACAHDSECVAVERAGCCHNGWLAAVNTSSVASYAKELACTVHNVFCTQELVIDRRVSQCNAGRCLMVAPEDIRCGGFTRNPHACAAGFQCHYPQVADIPGVCQPIPVAKPCVQNVFCMTTAHFDRTSCTCVAN